MQQNTQSSQCILGLHITRAPFPSILIACHHHFLLSFEHSRTAECIFSCMVGGIANPYVSGQTGISSFPMKYHRCIQTRLFRCFSVVFAKIMRNKKTSRLNKNEKMLYEKKVRRMIKKNIFIICITKISNQNQKTE